MAKANTKVKEESAGTALAVLDDTLREQLAGISGAEVSNNPYPRLRINNQAVDKETKQALPMGKWTIGDAKSIYADTAEFLILAKRYQFTRFVNNKLECESMYEKSGFTGEFLDTAGTRKCGKRSFKEMKGKPQEQIQENAKKGSYQLNLFGLVTMSGVDMNGNPAEVKNAPCVIKAKIKLKEEDNKAEEYLKLFRKRKKDYFGVITKLSKGDPEVNGTVTYYNNDFIMGDDVPLTQEIVDNLLAVDDYIEKQNARIYAKHVKAVRGEGDTSDLVDGVYEAEFEEEDGDN